MWCFNFYAFGGKLTEPAAPNMPSSCPGASSPPRTRRDTHSTLDCDTRQQTRGLTLTHQSNHQSTNLRRTSIARSALCAVPHTQPPRDTTHAEYVQALGFPPRRAVAPMARHASRKWSGAGTIMPFDSARRSTGAGEHPVQQRAARRRASPLQAARGSPQGRGCAADHSTARRAR